MSVTRAHVDYAKSILRQRFGNPYVYGTEGDWSPTNVHAGCDCSALVAHMLNAVLYGEAMTWQRVDPATGAWITTESWRPIEVGQRGPFGTITVDGPHYPPDATVTIAIHHGPGGGENSHMNCCVDGLLGESSGSYGCCTTGTGAIPQTSTYWNDWAYLPGPIVGTAPTGGPELTPEEHDKLLQVWGALFNPNPSKSRYGDPKDKWPTKDFIRNDDGFIYDLITEHDAALGDLDALARIRRAATAGDHLAAAWLANRTATPVAPAVGQVVPAQPTPLPSQPPPKDKPVLLCVNGFTGDMWQQMPADTGRAVQDLFYFQPVGYNSGAFPLGIGRDSGIAEVRRLLNSVYPTRRFAFAGFSLGAIVVDDVYDQIRDGDLQHRQDDFLGAVTWGNPRRPQGNWAGGGADPGGAGIAGPGNLKDLPPNFLCYANTGDIYTCCPVGPVGDDMTLVYNIIMTNWNGSLLSIITEAQELLSKPFDAVASIVMACVNGIVFAAQQQAPHLQYPIDDAVAFLKKVVAA